MLVSGSHDIVESGDAVSSFSESAEPTGVNMDVNVSHVEKDWYSKGVLALDGWDPKTFNCQPLTRVVKQQMDLNKKNVNKNHVD